MATTTPKENPMDITATIDRARNLAQTKSGSIYHVPGPWPDHIDLPAMDDFRARAGGAS
jgi:hypothetical protein